MSTAEGILEAITLLSERAGGLPVAVGLAVTFFEKKYTPALLRSREIVAGREAVEVLFDEFILDIICKHGFDSENAMAELEATIKKLMPATTIEGTSSSSDAASELSGPHRPRTPPAQDCLLRSRQYLSDIKSRFDVYTATHLACSARVPMEIVDKIYVSGLRLINVPTKLEAERQKLWESKDTLVPDRLDHQNVKKVRQYFTGWCVLERQFRTFKRHQCHAPHGCGCSGFLREFYLHDTGNKEQKKCMRLFSRSGNPFNAYDIEKLDLELQTGVVEIWEPSSKTLKDTCLFSWTIAEFYEWQNSLLKGAA